MAGTDFNLRLGDYARQYAARAAAASATATDTSTSQTSFGFSDVLDIINPLQHIPVVSTIYRHLTGDGIGVPEKIAGDTLYGGFTGFLSSVGDAIFGEVTGKNIGDTVYAAVFGDDSAPATAVASAGPPAGNATALVAQRASSAYRASGRLLEAY
jgi:hypothetical protein